MTYRIPNWDECFENNKSRAITDLRWVKMPNKHDSEGFRTIVAAGASVYGCWALMIQVASKCPKRGTLTRNNGKPHDAKSLALVTGASPKDFEDALPLLVEVGWLVFEVSAECPASVVEVPSKRLPSAHLLPKNGMEVNGSELKEEKTSLPIETTQSAPPNVSKKPESASNSKLQEWAETLYYKYKRKVDPEKSKALVVKHLKTFKTYQEQETEFERLKVHQDGYLKSDSVRNGFCLHSTTFYHSHLQSDLEAFRDAPKNAQAPPRSRLPNVSELDGVPDLPDAYYEQNGIERPSQEQEVELRNGLATIGNFGEPPI